MVQKCLPADLSLNNLQGGENLALSGIGTISDKNVANGKTLDVSGLTLGNGSGGTLARLLIIN